MCCGNLATSCHLSYSNSYLKETLNWQSATVYLKKKAFGAKPRRRTFDLQKTCGERHEEQSGQHRGSEPHCAGRESQGWEQLRAVGAVWGGCACLYLPPGSYGQATVASSGEQCLVRAYTGKWRRLEEDKEARHQERRWHTHLGPLRAMI